MFKRTYNIIFNTNGGNEIASISMKCNKQMIELPTPIKEGYNFMGWFIDESFNELCQYELMPKYDVNLYAKWESISLDEFIKDITFYTKSANILQSLQNDYPDVPSFKDPNPKKTIKKKTTKKKATTKKKVAKKVKEKANDNKT